MRCSTADRCGFSKNANVKAMFLKHDYLRNLIRSGSMVDAADLFVEANFLRGRQRRPIIKTGMQITPDGGNSYG